MAFSFYFPTDRWQSKVKKVLVIPKSMVPERGVSKLCLEQPLFFHTHMPATLLPSLDLGGAAPIYSQGWCFVVVAFFFSPANKM